MVRSLLLRGMLAGLVAGLLMFGVGRLLGEPQVDRAIAFESAMDAAKAKAAGQPAAAAAEEPELVSRSTQAGLGLFTAVTVYGAAFGGLFALVFAVADRRAATQGPRATAALLALAGFVAVYLVPSLKYPANPPAIGEASTIGHRTALFLLMLGASVAAMVLAAAVRWRLLPRLGDWSASLLAAALYGGAVLLAAAALPGVHETPDGFPADLLWQFRTASAAMQATLWAVLGLLFGWMVERMRYGRAKPALAA